MLHVVVATHCRGEFHNLIVGDAVDMEGILRDDGIHCHAAFNVHHDHSPDAWRLRTRGNEIAGSIMLSEIFSVCGKEAVASGVKAGDIIKAIAPICGGKGGGKPDSAMGGGTEVSKVDDALAAVDDLILSKLG